MTACCDKTPKISIILLTYNHEAYIRQALDSIISQKTEYTCEILIGDDCSPDNTQSIIKEYIQKYPGLIRAVLRKKNIGGKRNIYQLMMNCRGKYIAFLEGDDYWSDENKLQKQVNFLEKHPEYIGCAHRFDVVDRDGKVYYDRDFQVQFIDGHRYTLKDFEEGKLVSHFNSLVYRNIYQQKEKGFFSFWYRFDNMAGDATINLILSLMGDIYCLDDKMSCYRKVIDSKSTSFSAVQENENKRDQLFDSQLQLERLIYKKFHRKVSFRVRKRNIFASAVFKWRRDKTWKNWKVVMRIICHSGNPLYYGLLLVYLLAAKSFLWLIYKEDRRVPF